MTQPSKSFHLHHFNLKKMFPMNQLSFQNHSNLTIHCTHVTCRCRESSLVIFSVVISLGKYILTMEQAKSAWKCADQSTNSICTFDRTMHNASTVTLFSIIGKISRDIFPPAQEKMALSAFLVDQSGMRKKKFVDFNVGFAIENI